MKRMRNLTNRNHLKNQEILENKIHKMKNVIASTVGSKESVGFKTDLLALSSQRRLKKLK